MLGLRDKTNAYRMHGLSTSVLIVKILFVRISKGEIVRQMDIPIILKEDLPQRLLSLKSWFSRQLSSDFGMDGKKRIPILCVIIIYLLSIMFTSPTRHGADRFYVLALNLIENNSINIQKLVENNNHYALVTVDLFEFKGGRYVNVHPGQAFWGLPGLSIYRFIRHINNFSNGVEINRDASDKLDFILGTFAMNMTSNALFTAIAAMFFIYLVDRSLPVRKMKLFKISVYILLFYLATPLFYYSTHITQNQSESCLAFISLGFLCLSAFISDKNKRNKYFFVTGFFIGMTFLTNSSSLIILPFGVVHIFLSGFINFDDHNYRQFLSALYVELGQDWKRKFNNILFLCLGFLLPTLILFYYQYHIFSNPFIPVQSYIFGIHKTFSPTLNDYFKAFIMDVFETLFSPKVGLFSYSPLLLFPIVILFFRIKPIEQNNDEQKTSDQSLRKMLFRTMLMILPFYIVFYSLTGAKGFAEMGWEISAYNLYSARHILPIVFPLGYILFDVLINIGNLKPAPKWALWGILLLIWAFSLLTSVSATLLGDWIYSVNQVWGYIQYLFTYGFWGLINQGRSLIDW